jgi:hypothetical protein
MDPNAVTENELDKCMQDAAASAKEKTKRPVPDRGIKRAPTGEKFICTRGARKGKPCGYSSNDRNDFYFHQSGPSKGKVICCVDCESKRQK